MVAFQRTKITSSASRTIGYFGCSPAFKTGVFMELSEARIKQLENDSDKLDSLEKDYRDDRRLIDGFYTSLGASKYFISFGILVLISAYVSWGWGVWTALMVGFAAHYTLSILMLYITFENSPGAKERAKQYHQRMLTLQASSVI